MIFFSICKCFCDLLVTQMVRLVLKGIFVKKILTCYDNQEYACSSRSSAKMAECCEPQYKSYKRRQYSNTMTDEAHHEPIWKNQTEKKNFKVGN